MCVHRAAVITDAAHHHAVGDHRGREVDLFARHQIVAGQDPLQVQALLDAVVAFFIAERGHPSQDRAAESLDRTGPDQALGRAPHAHHRVDRRPRVGRQEGAAHVPALAQVDPGPCPADLFDQVFVPGPVDDEHGQVADVLLLGTGDVGEHEARRRIEGVRPDDVET